MYVFLFVVESAPISSFDLPPLFTEAAERAKTLVEKILRDIPTVYAATIYTEVIKMTKLLLKLFSYCLFSSLFNNLFLFPSGFDSWHLRHLHPDDKPADDDKEAGHPCRPSPQTTIWTLLTG